MVNGIVSHHMCPLRRVRMRETTDVVGSGFMRSCRGGRSPGHRRLARQSVKMALLLSIGLSACTGAPNPTTEDRWGDLLRSAEEGGANQLQVASMSDGVVTPEEYAAAVDSFISCADRNGITVRVEGEGWGEKYVVDRANNHKTRQVELCGRENLRWLQPLSRGNKIIESGLEGCMLRQGVKGDRGAVDLRLLALGALEFPRKQDQEVFVSCYKEISGRSN